MPVIAAAVIVRDGRVLLVRRRTREGSLSWQFPAGEVEPGETADQAATRETREETGLTVRVSAALGQRTHPHTGRTIHYYACDVLAGTAVVADPEELAELSWCDRAELNERVPHPFHPEVQKHLNNNLI